MGKKKKKSYQEPTGFWYWMTYALWFLFIGGKAINQEFFSQWFVAVPINWSLMILFPILITNSFLKYARANEHKWKKLLRCVELLFLQSTFILIINFSSVLVNASKELLEGIESDYYKPTLELLNDSVSLKREAGARFIYREGGVCVFYRDSLNQFVQFSPTVEDSTSYAEFAEIKKNVDDTKTFMLRVIVEAIYNEFMQIVMFLIISSLVLIIDFRKHRGQEETELH